MTAFLSMVAADRGRQEVRSIIKGSMNQLLRRGEPSTQSCHAQTIACSALLAHLPSSPSLPPSLPSQSEPQAIHSLLVQELGQEYEEERLSPEDPSEASIRFVLLWNQAAAAFAASAWAQALELLQV
jgi:hypothetical protein